MHQIKRQARKEAWYDDSWNPFRKNMRTSTFPISSSRPLDIEAAMIRRDEIEEDETPLSHFTTEKPSPDSRGNKDGDTTRRGSKEELEMTSALASSRRTPRLMDSEETAVERLSRPSSGDTAPKARRRHLFGLNKRLNKLRASLGGQGKQVPSHFTRNEWLFDDMSQEDMSWDPFGSISEYVEERRDCKLPKIRHDAQQEK